MRINRVGRRLLALAVCLCLLCTTAFAADLPEPPVNSCVLDDANVISQSTEDKLNTMFDQLSAAGSGQFAVVTVDFTGSRSTDEYAHDILNEWGVGDKEKDNGVVLVLAIGAEDYYCALGEKLDKKISASTLDRMFQRELEPDFAVGDYDRGTLKFMSAMYEELEAIYGEAGPLPEAIPQTEYEDSYEEESFGFNVLYYLLIVAVILIVIVNISGSVRRRRFTGYSGAAYAARQGRRLLNSGRRRTSSYSGFTSSAHSRPSRPSSSHRSSSRIFGGGSSRGSGAGRRTGGGRRR